MSRRTTLMVSLIMVTVTTALAQAAVKGWRSAIIAAGLSLAALMLGTELLRRLSSMQMSERSQFDDALRATARPPRRPADLETFERAFGWRSYSATEFDQRIRPELSRLHRMIVSERYSSSPTDDPDRFFAGRLQVLRPEASTPTQADTADLIGIVQAIEEM